MIKMELHEVNILLAIIEANQFQGKDVHLIAKLIEKLQKESMKLSPDKVIDG